MEDVNEIEALQALVSNTFGQAVEKRKDIEKLLQTAITANGESLKKLSSFAEIKQMSTKKIGSRFIITKLEETLEQAKREVNMAEKELCKYHTSMTKVVYP